MFSIETAQENTFGLSIETASRRLLRPQISASKLPVKRPFYKNGLVRIIVGLFVILLFFTEVVPVISQYIHPRSNTLSQQESALLPAKDTVLTKDITRDSQTGDYNFKNNAVTKGSTPATGPVVGASNTMITAKFPSAAASGMTVTDPVSSSVFKTTPKFALLGAQQDSSHVYYPFKNGNGHLVLSPQATDVLEDLVLTYKAGNTQQFDYGLNLGSTLAAREQHDGSIKIYGSSLASLGNISTDNPKDAALVQKAQAKAPKDKLLFTIPAPTVREAGKGSSTVKATYSLLDGGNTLRLTATNLKKANYPLDIDPTVSVASLSQLYRDTNGESNVDFNTSNGTINRGAVTGGVIDENAGWTTNSNNVTTGRFLSSAVVSNGYIYVAGGASANSTSNVNTIEYAQINSSTNTIGAWSTTSNLPANLSQFSLLTYNGYLYVLGGSTGTTGCSSPTSNVYYNPTQPNGALASTWTPATVLPASPGLCSFGAAIYNNTIYVVGGLTGASTAVATVYYASISPNGAVGTWTPASSTPLPVSMYGEDVQIYNGYIYAIGGMQTGTTPTTLSTIYRAPLMTSGGIYGSSSAAWVSLSNTFASADGSKGIANLGGGSFSTVNDGYMYVSGGCNTLNTSAACTAISTSSYIAQINADGTLGPWSLINLTSATGVKTNTEVGGNLLVFSNYIYSLTGCSTMNTTTISCTTAGTLRTQLYSPILSAGQLSPVSLQSSTLPTGMYDESTVVNNGYIYVIGGCITNSCDSGTNDTSSSIYYATISASGAIGTWSTSAFTINGSVGANHNGIAAAAAVVYDNYIYVMGGYNYSANSKNVWYAQINTTSGDLVANFAAAPNTLTNAEYSNAAITVGTSGGNAYAFVFGGCSAGAGAFGCSTYYKVNYRYTLGPVGPVSGTLIATVTALPDAHDTANSCVATVETSEGWTNSCYTGEAAMGAAYYNGYIYLAGGASDCNGGVCTGGSSGQSSVVQYAKITSGTVGAWAYATNFLPKPLRRTAAYAYNDNLYIVGGHNALDHTQTANGTTYAYIDIGLIDQSNGNLDDSSGIYASASQLVSGYNEWDGSVSFADGTIYETGGCIVGYPPTSCTSRGTQTQSFQIYNADNTGTGTWLSAGNTYASIPTYGANTAASSATSYTVPSTNQTYIYVAGGCTSYNAASPPFSCGSTSTLSGYTAVNPDGSLGTWAASTTQLPVATSSACLLQANGYLYYIGGLFSSGGQTATVYYSQIQTNGQPGAWTTATNGLPVATGRMACDSSNGVLYVTGGNISSGYSNTTYYVAPGTANAGNITTAWSTGSSTFTTGRADVASVIAGGYLYVMGGYDGTNYTGSISATVTNGGKPEFTTASTANLNAGQYVVMSGTANYNGTFQITQVNSATQFTINTAYSANNTSGSWSVPTSTYSEVQYVPINPTTGAMTGTWSYTNSFPYPASQISATVANGYMYVFGGRTNHTGSTNCSQSTFIAPILSTGQLGIWTKGINNFTTARVAAASTYANGYYYVIGGASCGGGLVANASAIQYSGSQSPTTNSFFSRYADLGGDASPELFLSFVTNAQINSTDIEDWKMAYITSTQTSNSWGVATYITPLTSGTVTRVYAYNGAGTQVYLDRYVQLAFSISMTKSFTFPDTTPPSINSYYMYYSPAPQTRLRNGKDFQDEQQQGLDLNY